MSKQVGKVLTATKIYFDATYFNSQAAGGAFSGDMDDIPDGTTYVKTHNDLLNKITVGTTEPVAPQINDIWIDTN